MGERLECPGCGSYTSGVLNAFRNDEPCPYCGLSTEALVEISAIRLERADSKLKQVAEDAIKDRDRYYQIARAMFHVLSLVKRTNIEEMIDEARKVLFEDGGR